MTSGQAGSLSGGFWLQMSLGAKAGRERGRETVEGGTMERGGEDGERKRETTTGRRNILVEKRETEDLAGLFRCLFVCLMVVVVVCLLVFVPAYEFWKVSPIHDTNRCHQ